MKRLLVALAALFVITSAAAPAGAIVSLAPTGTEKVAITLGTLRSNTTSCSIKVALSAATPNRWYVLQAGNPSQGNINFATDRRGQFSGTFNIPKSVLQSTSSAFYLAYTGIDWLGQPVTIPSAVIKVTNRCVLA